MDSCVKNSSVRVKQKNKYCEKGVEFVRIKRKVVKKTIRRCLEENQPDINSIKTKLLAMVKKMMHSAFLINREKNQSMSLKINDTITPDQFENITKKLIFNNETETVKTKSQEDKTTEKEKDTSNNSIKRKMPLQF